MKAVFVIDLPVALENLLGEELILYITHKDDRYIMTEESKLRPLPHKLQADWYTDGYKEGFNACLEDITGETE